VAGYTITITPNDDDTGAQTIIRVDTTTGTPRVMELTVSAPGGGGLSPHELPAVNLEQLIAALAPTPQAAIASAPAAPTVVESTAAPAGRGGRSRKRAGRKAPAKKAATTRTRQARAAKVTASRGESADGRRAYRRMPEGSEVAELYRTAGTATAVAEHYGVPRHTASGWVRRLRSQGLLESA
jgi:hypothetical protein